MSGVETLDRRRFYRKYADREKEKSVRTKRRVEINIETTRMTFERPAPLARSAWCVACGAQVQMLTIDEAATVAGTSPRAIFHLLEAQKVHFSETPGSPILICPSSLLE